MSNFSGAEAVDFSCSTCEHRDLLCDYVGLFSGLRADYISIGQNYEMQRVLAYDAEARGVTADLLEVKNDIIDCAATTEVKILEIDLLFGAIQNMDCAVQQSDRCPKIDALMDFKDDER